MPASLPSWIGPAAALGVGYWAYGWPGLVLALTVIVFVLLLQWSRALRVLRRAGAAPVGVVPSAVMLHARLNAGMSMADLLAVTGCLGRRVERDVTDQAGADEAWRWQDADGSRVDVRMQHGRVCHWTLTRSGAGKPNETAPIPSRGLVE